MSNIFLIAGIISFIFFIFKFIEMRFVDKENKPFKIIFRDCLVVYFSVILGNFIIEQVLPISETIMQPSVPMVFTDEPF
jgi:hypothetical protein